MSEAEIGADRHDTDRAPGDDDRTTRTTRKASPAT